MRHGLRTEEIEIQHRVETGVTSMNEPIFEWQTFAAPLVSFEARRGREHLAADRVFTQSYVVFTAPVDEIQGVDATMRIRYDGKIYDIRNVRADYPRNGEAGIEAVVSDMVV